jgi:hypothetical protein
MRNSQLLTGSRVALACGLVVALMCTAGLSAADKAADKSWSQLGAIALQPAQAAEDTPAAKDKPAVKEKPAAEAKTEGCLDPVEDRQSFNTYTSLEDGQPGQPGEFQINYFNGWETASGDHDRSLMAPQIEYTLGRTIDSPLRNTKLGMTVPLVLGDGGVDGNGDIEVHWIQRWYAEKEGCWLPTFSTVNELRIPSGYHSSKVDWRLTGVLAKDLGPGTAYFNAFLKSANGHNNLESPSSTEQFFLGKEEEDMRNFQWGFRTGYKWRITESFALIADYVLESSELRGNHDHNIGEISAEWRVTDALTIGPGIYFGLDGTEETPNFGAGLLLHYSFN